MLALALFARPPVAGTTKTRLIPALGADGAARLYQAFLADAVAKVEAVPAILPRCWWSEAIPEATDATPAAVHEWPQYRQADGDLGHRMAVALEALCEAHGAGAILGTDAPTLPRSVLARAASALTEDGAGPDVVLGPCADGGYYLVASRVPMHDAFSQVRWSTEFALEDTVRGAEKAGYRVAFLPPWYDVDVPDDLRLLRSHLTIEPSAAPATANMLFTCR